LARCMTPLCILAVGHNFSKHWQHHFTPPAPFSSQ
jgi:hypothetical protein